MTVRVPRTPAVGPRLVLAAGATAAALLLPFWAAVAVLACAFVPLLARGGGAWRAPAAVASLLGASTVLLTPVWLHLLGDVALRAAYTVAAALALRLAAVVAVGLALATLLPARSWLAALAGFPRLGLAWTLTVRQVPDLAADAARIRRAQRARGLLVHRTIGAGALAVPLVTRALDRADHMGEALTLAGWGRGRRVPAVRARWDFWDPLWALAGGVLLLVAAYWTINLA